jgi:hypothetical protein
VKRSSAVQALLEVSMSPRTVTSRRFEPMYLMGTLRPSVDSETATEVKHGGGLLSEPTTREDGHRRDPHRPPPGTTPACPFSRQFCGAGPLFPRPGGGRRGTRTLVLERHTPSYRNSLRQAAPLMARLKKLPPSTRRCSPSTQSSRVADQAVRSRHRSSPRRPVTRSVPPLHAPRSHAPTRRTTQLSSRPARRELESSGSRDESVHARVACSRIRGLSITRRHR